jgi:hypothetical protein
LPINNCDEKFGPKKRDFGSTQILRRRHSRRDAGSPREHL